MRSTQVPPGRSGARVKNSWVSPFTTCAPHSLSTSDELDPVVCSGLDIRPPLHDCKAYQIFTLYFYYSVACSTSATRID
jgi:hypothetical protein